MRDALAYYSPQHIHPEPVPPMRLLPFAAAAALAALPLQAQQAQQAQQALTAAPSTRATFTLTLNPPRQQGQPAPAPKLVRIDYGQPHARGRNVPVELSQDTVVWRVGANASTTLTTDVDLTIGGAAVPAGAYSLYAVREKGQYFLIINRNTGQWGTEYDKSKDLVRVPLTARALHETQESLQIAMVPPMQGPPAGAFTIAWGQLHLSTTWSVR